MKQLNLNKQICIAISSAVLACSLGYANPAFAKLANQKDQSLFDELEYGSNEGKSRPEVIEALLKAGANVNANNGGVTPLHDALYEDDTTVAEILVKHGADVNAKIKEAPLIMTMISSGSIIGWSETELKMRVEFLLKHNANPNAVDSKGATALHRAAYKNNPEIINALLTAGAEVNAKDKKGSTPLMNAVYQGHVEITELLLKKGANPNVVTNDGVNALRFAVQEIHFPVVKLLIEYHADPNIGESVGYELYTAKREKPAIAKEMEDYLFSHGADKKAYLAGYQYAEKVVADTKKIKAEGERADEEAKRAAEEAKRAAEEAKRAAEEAAKYAEGANEYRKMIRQLSFIK